MTIELTQHERALFNRLAVQLDPLPEWLIPRLEQYAIARRQWEILQAKLRKCKDDTRRYKLVQECSMLAKQFDAAATVVEREIQKQIETKEAAAAAEEVETNPLASLM